MTRLMDALRDRLREWLVPDLAPLPPRAGETPAAPRPSAPEPRVTPGAEDESGMWVLYPGQKQLRGILGANEIKFVEQEIGLKYEIELEKISKITVLVKKHKEEAAPCFGDHIARIKLVDGQILTGSITPYAVPFISGAIKIYITSPERTDFRVVRRN